MTIIQLIPATGWCAHFWSPTYIDAHLDKRTPRGSYQDVIAWGLGDDGAVVPLIRTLRPDISDLIRPADESLPEWNEHFGVDDTQYGLHQGTANDLAAEDEEERLLYLATRTNGA